MKILHTADWHLGKKLDRFSRLEEQIEVLEEIIGVADEKAVDLVLIAGDLFDNFNPSVEAIELFYKTLKRLTSHGKRPVIAISGNHDSPYLVDSPNSLARECGIILIGHPNTKVQPMNLEHFKITASSEGFFELQLKNQNFPVRIVHTPYASEMRLKEYFGENKEAELNRVLAENWAKNADDFCDEKGVNLLMAHLYMNKKGAPSLEEPEGEKPLKMGNADLIFSESIPTQIQYTALGHLHAFNNIGTAEKPVVYSSSPLCYSFSEAGQTKYVSMIEAEPNQPVSFQKIPLTKGKKLFRKTFDSVDQTVAWLSAHPGSLVEITLESETFLKAEERKQIYNAHDGIVHLIPKVKNQEFTENNLREINLGQEILPLFQDYFKSKNSGQEANEDLIKLFQEISNS